MAKTYLVNIPMDDHTFICGEVRADTWAQAEQIAEARGYELLGPLVDTVECSAEVEAMIQKQYHTAH